MQSGILYDIIVLFLLSIGVTLLCSRFKLPVIVGFLLTGVLCGPSALGVVRDHHAITHIADLGVAMLLFTIGMELSGEALNRLKRPVFLGGSLQIGLTLLAITGLRVLQGNRWEIGLLWGCLVALSSSAIVLQIMQEKGTTATPAGSLSLAILVFQDIMVAPMLLGVPLLSGQLNLDWQDVLLSIGKTVCVLGGVVILAHLCLGRLMDAVMRTRSREILLLTTLGICMGMALLTESLGMSLSLGAFLAGLLLARSQYSMSVIANILPYRDVFMSLFFISVGMILDVHFLYTHIWVILFNTLLFIVIKTLLTLPSVLVQGYPLKVACTVSLSLAQVGEFAFVLAASGLATGLFNMQEYQGFLAVSVISMMLTPALMALAPVLANHLPSRSSKNIDVLPESTHNLDNHLIIVGFGITGKYLAQVARQSGITYTILEMNPETVTRYRDKEPIAHGDASQPSVLKHLQIEKAKVLAIVISDPTAVRATTIAARRLNPNLHIVARTRFVTEIAHLRRLGANIVISEEFETAIEVFSSVLTQYLIPKQDIDAFAASIRQKNYRMLRRLRYTVGSLEDAVRNLPDMGTQAMRVCANTALCGLSLQESELRPKFGVTVISLLRNGQTIPVEPATRFSAGDIVYLFAPNDKLIAVAPLFVEAVVSQSMPQGSRTG